MLYFIFDWQCFSFPDLTKQTMMKLIKSLPLFTLLLFYISSCTPKMAEPTPACGPQVMVDEKAFTDTESANYTLLSYSVEGDCLSIEVGASGCSEDLWNVKLLASEYVLETYPVQQPLRFILKNEQMCQAYFTKTFKFDISALKQKGGNEVSLNIEGVKEPLMYSY